MTTIFFSLFVIGISILLGYLAYKFSKKRITGSVVVVVVAIAMPIFLTYPQLFFSSIITIVFWFAYVVKEIRI
ncbi:TcpD family membrane protein [Priestia aryabhattai]|uniref:TcpD family membrane protein n=1 Tax=Priestia TaxID=2800373 RepID=UPI001FB1D736|nr:MULTISPECIES: TcpD family membrane protein [Priestia]MED5244024.1 TcpD family membrane protein [Priestia sp. LL-8]